VFGNKVTLGLAPGRTIPQSFQSRAEIKACYNFLDNDLVSEEKLLNPHIEKTITPQQLSSALTNERGSTYLTRQRLLSTGNYLEYKGNTTSTTTTLHQAVPFQPT